ncbi:MAG: putative addiction module antidote protein [Robiginitomaculum sp.]|nr:putative addiction module antidote protein [Robiginitomaculum sp.]
MDVKTTPFDAAHYLEDDEEIAYYLSEAFETGDPEYINHALGVAAKARGMTQIAKDSGVKREALYRSLSQAGNPQFTTILAVMRALGLNLKVEVCKKDVDDGQNAH